MAKLEGAICSSGSATDGPHKFQIVLDLLGGR